MENSLIAQQQTLLWDEDKYLGLAPGENQIPKSLLFDEYAKELSFPGIYLGHIRTFRQKISVTPFQMATTEIRRTDRRGVNPHHLLYMAAKNMRLRVASSLTIAFKFVGNDTKVTKQTIKSEEYVNDCLETNLAFLKSIPNSVCYWSQRKDLFAMIRQLERPTVFLTMSANEIGWIPLLQLLQKFKDGRIISENEASELNWLQKSTLINEDAVICAIYFDKLVNTLMTLLQNKGLCPFKKYKVKDYLKQSEFQHRGSPHAHILLWLEDAPNSPLGDDKVTCIQISNVYSNIMACRSTKNEKSTHGIYRP
ncbi:hypothetical protein EVAR_7364_1 [Eumeta japonica]|uniref:Helitron helicase-like domain-containing protein n=1 Tax=Eumeta variegata TaxID=151549 RepID=A0A4C1V687_EUMVA|nr:hypothetical protein EVAR_7364_1 [Eumeta japonica]